MIKKRIVITGIGIVSPIGIGKEAYGQALQEGKSGIKPITLFDTSEFNVKVGGEIGEFDAKEILGKKGLLDLDRATKLLMCATKFALDDSALVITGENTRDIGVSVGTTLGTLNSVSSFNQEAYTSGPKYVNPSQFPNTVVNSPASRVGIRFQIKGFNSTISTGMCAFLDALDYACDSIRLDKKKTILVGGVEDLSLQMFLGFYKLGQLSHSGISCPFDEQRDGLVLSEGATVFVVEEYETAKQRGARIYGEVLSVASSFDPVGFYRYNPKGTGMVKAMELALRNAELKPQDIDGIFANANSTPEADVIESNAIEKVFGKVPVTAIKSMMGETYSVSGGFALAAALEAMNNNCLPATINVTQKDPACRIEIVCNRKRCKEVKKVMINTFSPDGANTVAIVGNIQ